MQGSRRGFGGGSAFGGATGTGRSPAARSTPYNGFGAVESPAATSSTATSGVPAAHVEQQQPKATEEDTEEDWRRREEKRRAAVALTKATPEYEAFCRAACGAGGPKDMGEAAPRTPPPDDRSISKRAWESKVMNWRAALRNWCSERGVAIREVVGRSEEQR